MMAPFQFGSIALTALRECRKALVTFVAMMRSQSSRLVSARSLNKMRPALLTRMSRRPKRQTASATAVLALPSARSGTSPFRSSSSMTGSKSSATTLASRACSNSAVARPMPLAVSMTIATLPSTSFTLPEIASTPGLHCPGRIWNAPQTRSIGAFPQDPFSVQNTTTVDKGQK